MKRRFQIEFLKRAGLQPDHHLLDVGCGTLRGGIPIIELLEPGHYFGLEVRDEVLDEAREELREAGLEHKKPALVRAADLAGLEFGVQFDFIWAFSSLIHMSDDVLDRCFVMVRRHLKPGGRFYANVLLGNQELSNWREFPVIGRSMDRYANVAGQHGLSVGDEGSLEQLGHVSGDERQDQHRMLRFAPAP